jgi:hypothetical protein
MVEEVVEVVLETIHQQPQEESAEVVMGEMVSILSQPQELLIREEVEEVPAGIKRVPTQAVAPEAPEL